MKTNICIKICLILVLSIILCVTEGCNRNTTIEKSGELILFVERNELCSFSFEYSSYYTLVGPDYALDFVVPFMYITLLAPKDLTEVIVPINKDEVSKVVAEYVPAAIEITVAEAVDSVNAAGNAKEEIEEVLKDCSKHDNYRFVTGYPLDIAGQNGDFIEYYVRDEHTCAVYFDFDGLIWSIELISRGDYDYSKIKADFDHIVETFKILD